MSGLFYTLIEIYMWLVVIRVVISWLNIDAQNAFVKYLADVTDPVLAKIREVIPAIGGFDLSPLVLIVALLIIRNLLI